MTSYFNRFKADNSGGPAAEFALVLPIMILFLFGIIDVGRLMWTWNQAEKATQMGVRYAVVTNMVPPGLSDYSFSIDGGLLQGAPIPKSSFGGAQCQLASATDPNSALSCTCFTGETCPPLGTPTNDAAAPFPNIVNRMNAIYPSIAKNNVVVEYAYSGLGYAGDPFGPDVAPLVTVRLRNMTFTPILLQVFGGSITLPDFRASLTLEDGVGSTSN
jgi:Flp pilus assembly pilin Flp